MGTRPHRGHTHLIKLTRRDLTSLRAGLFGNRKDSFWARANTPPGLRFEFLRHVLFGEADIAIVVQSIEIGTDSSTTGVPGARLLSCQYLHLNISGFVTKADPHRAGLYCQIAEKRPGGML
jgi:hypothetical protein